VCVFSRSQYIHQRVTNLKNGMMSLCN